MLESDMDKWWSDIAPVYKQEQQRTIQGASILFNMSRAWQAKRILEVGCGPGMAVTYFLNTLMPRGSTYLVTDLADGMLDATEEAIRKTGWADREGHSLKRLDSSRK